MHAATSPRPEIDPLAPLIFIINGASGRQDAEAKGGAIEQVLAAAGRRGELRLVPSSRLRRAARLAAADACSRGTALVGVGGDGTLNAVAQAAHDAGCVMGVIPRGTFNYFARSHGIPEDPAEATAMLLQAHPTPVQVGAINDKVFLVNAGIGLFPELLQDREAYKARFGRSRWIAFVSGMATLMQERRQLRLHIEHGGEVRDLRTSTLFVGNNRLQLERVGLPEARAIDEGRMAGVMLHAMGTMPMLWLMLRGAFGMLGEARTVDSFEFQRMTVRPWLPLGVPVKVGFDGEVGWMRPPLSFGVSPRPLYLLKPAPP